MKYGFLVRQKELIEFDGTKQLYWVKQAIRYCKVESGILHFMTGTISLRGSVTAFYKFFNAFEKEVETCLSDECLFFEGDFNNDKDWKRASKEAQQYVYKKRKLC